MQLSRLKISLFIYSALFSSSAWANESVNLQLRWHHQFQFAGYYAALEKGYYANAGLDVSITEGSPEHEVINVPLYPCMLLQKECLWSLGHAFALMRLQRQSGPPSGPFDLSFFVNFFYLLLLS